MTMRKHLIKALLGLSVSLTAETQSLALADNILPSMAQVDPIVILFMDTSPSMAAMSTSRDYQPDVAYDGWTFHPTPGIESLDTIDGPYMDIRDLDNGNCPVGFIQGMHQSNTQCLRLPTSDDGNGLYERNYLNFLFTHFPDGTDLTQRGGDQEYVIPTQSRFSVLQSAARRLVELTPDITHCLTSMDENGNLRIVHECDGASEEILTAIDGLEVHPDGESRLASLYRDTIRWIRGLAYPHGANSRSPLRYRCQDVGQVVFTDGYAVGDDPSDYSGMDAEAGGLPPGTNELPDWDNLAPPTTAADFDQRAIPEHSDGFGGVAATAGSHLFLDDLTAFGAAIDLRTENDNDDSGLSFGTPWPPGQSDRYTHQRLKGFFVSPRDYGPVLDEAAHAGGGRHLGADKMQLLARALLGSLPHPRIERASETMPVAHLSDDGSTLVYVVNYDPMTWTGSIAALPITLSGIQGPVPSTDALWFAEDGIPPHDHRRLFSFRWPPAGDSDVQDVNTSSPMPIELHWDQLSPQQQEHLLQDSTLLDWVAGDPGAEASVGGRWRDRESLLGDIVHTEPVLLPRAGAGNYPDPDHRVHKEQRLLSDRRPVLFAGANDGLLHAFSAGEHGGEELFAYLPAGLLPKLPDLARPPLIHQWMLDGQLTLEDARIGDPQLGNPWRSILTGTLGQGGPGVFALDVSEVGIPSHPLTAADLLLWEIGREFPRDDNDSPLYPDLGQQNFPVSMVRVLTESQGEHWLTVVPNGAASSSGNTVLYLVRLSDGLPFQEIRLANDEGGGLVTANAVDTDGDSYIDRIYAGDLHGRVWRVDWDAALGEFVSTYESEGEPVPFFQTSDRQIPSQGFAFSQLPGLPAEDGLLIHFGTETQQNDGMPGTNALYGIWDSGDVPLLSPNQLAPRTLSETQIGEFRVRLVSGSPFQFNPEGIRGWKIVLSTADEKILRAPLTFQDRVIFTTRADPPGLDPDPCQSAPQTWVTEVDTLSGLAPSSLTLDINRDGTINRNDKVNGAQIPASTNSDEDAGNGPGFIRLTGADGQQKLVRIEGSLSGRVSMQELPTTLRRFGWRRLRKP